MARKTAVTKTYRRECLDGLLLQVIPVQIELGVVDGKSTLGPLRASQKGLDGRRHHTVVRAILGVLEVHVRDPVVGEIFGHLAGCARGPRADITLPGKEEEENCQQNLLVVISLLF